MPSVQPLAWPRLEKDLVDPLLQLLPFVLRLVGAAARQDDDELVAGVTDADVVGADRGAQDARHLAQRPVADMVAVVVVDFLEAVEIHDQSARLPT